MHIPTEVYKEIQTGLEEGYLFYTGIEQYIYPFATEGWLRLINVTKKQEWQLWKELPTHLHSGEASCLVIAQHRGWTLLTDDLAARKEATRRGINKSGSLGCLVLAVQRGHCNLEEANNWLPAMIKNNYRSPVLDLSVLLNERKF